MKFSPVSTRAKWDAILVSGWLALAALLILRWSSVRPTDWLRYVLFILLLVVATLSGMILYRVWGMLTLEYRLDRNAIAVHSRRSRLVIPLGKIKRVIENYQQDTHTAQWWMWPASYMRTVQTDQGLLMTMLATRSVERCQVIDTGDALYALSPQLAENFLTALQENFRLGAVGTSENEEPAHTFDFQLLLGVNKVARRVLLAGLLGVVLLFAVLLIRYPFLPDTLVVRFDSSGLPELVRDKSGLFLLPMIGLITWVVNGAWGIWMASSNQLTGAYLLWSGSVVVHICLFFALVSLVL